jgi:uridine phosphorylase
VSEISSCLINPKKSRSEPFIDSTALLIPIPGDLQRTVRFFKTCGRLLFKNPMVQVVQINDSGRHIALAGPAVGAPQAVMILEKLVALGAKRVVFFGWTGGLQKDLSPGDIILPDEAISEEGTSRHYSDEHRSRPSFKLLQDLKKSLETERIAYRQGSIWTTDAPYRETIHKVKSFQAQGILGVEMEVSALFTVGAFRGIETAAVLIVSDDLSGMTWRHGFRESKFLAARKQVTRFLYHFILRPS